jgi:phosphoribosylaminoimidazolecarboxamide formyltransferase/IMP cyclohydrolase
MPENGAALISVYDRTGVVELASALIAAGKTVYATGGSAAHLRAAGLAVRDVEDLTGFPSMFDGRVKTLHPNVFGGILRDTENAVHVAEAEQYRIPLLSTIVVNLYPFESTVAREGATLQEAIEQIDIGGVSLLRAAAKNFERVTVLSDPSQYAEAIAALPRPLDREARRRLATRAFERTAEYDSAIASYMESGLLANELPGSLALTIPIAQPLRYGENPQDRAAFYLARETQLPEQLWGKELSYNNLLDLDATLRLLVRARAGMDVPAAPAQSRRAAIVKHTIPCGVAERATVAEAVRAAVDADPTSAYGGIIAVDGTIDLATAEGLRGFFLEIVAAPAFDADALERLKKRKDLRIMRFDPGMPQRIAEELRVRSALGGVLAEDDDPRAQAEAWRVVSKRQPEPGEWRDILFAWDIVRHVKSNGVVLVRDAVSRGICAGQTNRVSAVTIAGERAGSFAAGAACASDGYFPFADGLIAAADAGCTSVIAPGGSIRDPDVIAAADERNIALVFSNYRFFLH